MRYWLMKSEPDDVSIDDMAAEPSRAVPWTGVRNFQARNFMREMQVGDLVFFYHSSCKDIGIAGIVEVAGTSYPDPTQFDAANPYFDARSTQENPRWLSVDVRHRRKTALIGLAALRACPELDGMRLLAKGSRLSVMPVESAEWRVIEGLMDAHEPRVRG